MLRFAYVHLVLITLVGCAAGARIDPFSDEKKFWPDPPEVKRIAFVGDFSNAADLGIRESAWSRLVRITAGARSDEMVRPMAVAASTDATIIFVADPDARCVHRYDLRRGQYRCLMISRKEAILSPVGLAVSDTGRLYVSDSRSAHIYYAESGDKWLQRLDLNSSLEQPTGIAWDDARQILFVVDTGSQSIKAFDKTGVLVREFGGRGLLPGAFNFPTYLWIDPNQQLLVTDSLNFRVQRFGDAGEFLFEFGDNGDLVGDFARPKGVATDSYGHIYVVDALLNALQVFTRDGDFLIAIGEQGQAPGQFWLPNGIFISDDNTIYVADSHNKRVQVFRYVGPAE
jgi:sugar lactone lactonase YvrE